MRRVATKSSTERDDTRNRDRREQIVRGALSRHSRLCAEMPCVHLAVCVWVVWVCFYYPLSLLCLLLRCALFSPPLSCPSARLSAPLFCRRAPVLKPERDPLYITNTTAHLLLEAPPLASAPAEGLPDRHGCVAGRGPPADARNLGQT